MRHLSTDPITGIITYHDYDPQTDTTKLIYVSDTEGCLDNNKALANDSQHTRQGMKNDFLHYASIPAGVQLKWMIEKGVDVYNRHHSKEVLALVNQPEYRYLKTTSMHHE